MPPSGPSKVYETTCHVSPLPTRSSTRRLPCKAERGTITVRTGVDGDHVWVEFEDTGGGISPELRQRIFDPFFTTKPVGSGTGLGLSISYSIINKHHGRIDLDSTPGVGSRFRVVLPVKQPR